MHKAAGRSWPIFSPDDVIDYMIMEAVCLKVQAQDEKDRKAAEKKAKQEEFKSDRSDLKKFI